MLEVMTRAIIQGKEIKGIQIGNEEVKLSLFADDMIAYVENFKESKKKKKSRISEFSKVTGCKCNTHRHKSIILRHTNNEHVETKI